MIPHYDYICKHFNATTERAMSYEYDEDLFELAQRCGSDPRLPTKLRVRIANSKQWHRDLVHMAVRSYAYALRYDTQVREPIHMMRYVLHWSIRNMMGAMPITYWKQTKVWREAWAQVLLDELLDEAMFVEKFTVIKQLRQLNYWSNGSKITQRAGTNPL